MIGWSSAHDNIQAYATCSLIAYNRAESVAYAESVDHYVDNLKRVYGWKAGVDATANGNG